MKVEAANYLDEETMSPPSRRRGLKASQHPVLPNPLFVASFAEAWIESLTFLTPLFLDLVASFAEAWIERVN